MDLPRSLLKDFAEVTNDTSSGSVNNQYVRGTVKVSGETKYVQIDGSSSLTPISEVVDVQDGDRVLVSIENHKATILGNFTFPPSARKEQEAVDKAEGAQSTADTANTNSNAAIQAAQEAQENADKAISDAGEASRLANEAKENSTQAITEADAANTNAQEAKEAATSAAQDASTARQEAAAAQSAVANANSEIAKINGDITKVKGDIDTALGDLADQAAEIEATKETMELNYAKKTEVSTVEANLKTEISKKVGELQATVEQNYAGKTDLTSLEGKLQSQITQNAENITSSVSKIEKLESDTTEARKDIDDALSKATAAQTAASDAQTKATAAQTAADEAKANASTAATKADAAQTVADAAQAKADAADKAVQTAQGDLNEAKQNLANVTSRVGATEAEIAEAQSKVDAAQKAVDNALADAAEANLAATNAKAAADKAAEDAAQAQADASNAQIKADNAQAAADKAQADAEQAQKDVAALTSRVTSAETNISQNAERIALTAEKTEEIGTKLDNLEVGGRNFWPNSSFQNDLEGYLIDGASTGTVEVVEGYGGRPGIRITRSGYEGTSRIGLHIKPILTEYSAGDEFTLSAWIKIDAAFDYENNDIFVRGVSGDNANYDRPLINNITHNGVTLGKWMRYETTFTAESDGTFVNCYILMGKNGDMTVSNVKFERGNKVTDWTPAPEDFENNYYSKTETEALLQVESDKITSKVSQTITEEVNKIEIGGRNLLLDTNASSLGAVSADEPRRFQDAISNSENYDVSWVPISDAPQGIEYGAQIEVITASETDNYQGLVFYRTHGPELTDGETYTLSYYARCTQGTAYTRTEIWNHHISDPLELTEDWAKNSLTFTFDDSKSSSVPYALFQTNLKYVGIIQMCGFKLEKGNKVTDWTPAPEDVRSGIDNAQSTADVANSTANSADSRVAITESEIQQLADSISTLVTDSEGNSMMTQTSDGWRFDISTITDNLDAAQDQLNELAGSVADADRTIQNVKDLADDLAEKTAYIVMTTDDAGDPCIELGKSDNDFKLRITNTSIDFMDGSSRVAYVSNQSLYIGKAIIRDELQIGEGTGYVWKKRSNGNMGLRYVGG